MPADWVISVKWKGLATTGTVGFALTQSRSRGGGKIDQGSVIVNLVDHHMIDDAASCGVNIRGEPSDGPCPAFSVLVIPELYLKPHRRIRCARQVLGEHC